MNLIGNINAIPFRRFRGGSGATPPFPSIPGMIARYSASGLTNEQMAANPVWVDKTGNGHDLQMKNFAWGGMSGVGGYNQNFNRWGYGNLSTATQTHTSYKIELSVPSTLKTANIYSNAKSIGKEGDVYDFTLNIVGLKDGALLRITKGVVSGVIERIEKDGIYKIYQPIEAGWDQPRIYIFISNPNLVDLNITIEQLPLYPGALVFDGVDDCGVCDNFPILTKEKGYTVVALRSYLAESIGYLVYNGTSAKQSAFVFERSDSLDTWSWGKNSSIRNLLPKLMSYQTSNSYNNNIISTGTAIEGDKLIRIASSGGYCNVAIWELVFLDHDATEEELTKIKDYFVKTYPWLFFDQAWTVVGKTNEDEDRATIANITGNGNDLVLSNFGFAEGSGYGLYYQYFGNEFKATNGEIEGGGWNIIDNYNISHDKRIPINSVGKCLWGNKALVNGIKLRFKLTGMTEGDVLAFGYAAAYDLTYTSDGIYAIDLPPVDKSYGFSLQSSLTENLPTTTVTIELLPFEYEGYLVTDGVDDKILSSSFLFGNDFTVVGEWEFLQEDSNVLAGFNKNYTYFVLYNYISGVNVYVKNGKGTSIRNTKTLKAVTSEGLVYIDFNSEQKVEIADKVEADLPLYIAYNGNNYTKMAFKNLAIYPTVLSKDDCIKAYNYLQTLKAK